MHTADEVPAATPFAGGGARRFAVFGQPIAHSLSPRIHTAFAHALGIPLEYRAIEASMESFVIELARFGADGGLGANVTLPLKQHAALLCLSLSERSQRANSVNTLVRHGEGWHGDTTDGTGLIRDLTGRHELDVRERRTLLLGAGGAARGVAYALLDAGIGELTIANRTPERADALADAIGEPERVNTRYWDDLGEWGAFDLVVNATSAGHGAGAPALKLPASLIAPRAICYDLSYGTAAFGFLAWARSVGAAHALDGLGMLVEQAAESFAIWNGERPDTTAVYADLRAHVPGDAED